MITYFSGNIEQIGKGPETTETIVNRQTGHPFLPFRATSPSPVVRIANALATEVDMSDDEGPRGKSIDVDLSAIGTGLATLEAQPLKP
jgi:hypothetical protein